MSHRRLQDQVALWEILRATASDELAGIPHAAADLAELDRMIQAGKDLEVQRAALRESLSRSSHDRAALTLSGSETYRRLSLGLRAKLGPRSEALLRFGVTPQKTRRRKATGSAPPPAVEAPPIERPAAAEPRA